MGGFAYEAGVDRQITKFIELINTKYLSTDTESRPVDFALKTQYLALDVIGDISFGQPFGYLTTDRDLWRYNEINTSSLPIMNFISVLPWVAKILYTWPVREILPKEGDQIGFGRLMRYVQRPPLAKH
jgi:hypothetical protein